MRKVNENAHFNYMDFETAKAITRTWLETEFDGGRHEGRIAKISRYEEL